MTITFFVPGVPIPQGSAKGFPIKRANGKLGVVITSDNKRMRPWRLDVKAKAAEAMDNNESWPGACRVVLGFYFARPKSLPKRVLRKTTKPDIDKLIRAALDAMTGVVFDDDSQVVSVEANKRFADDSGAFPPGMYAMVQFLEE